MNEKFEPTIGDTLGWLRAFFGLSDDPTERIIWREGLKAIARHWRALTVITFSVHLLWHVVFKGLGVAFHRLGWYWLAWLFDVDH